MTGKTLKSGVFCLLFFLLPISGQGMESFQAQNMHIGSSRWPDSSDMKWFSQDAIRFMGARTHEEKAMAIWRFIRMWTAYTTGVIPKEPKLGNNYVNDPLKVLNVYGAHHCDGLARIMEAAWRSLGMRAEKLYRSGHTQADLFWEDADGVFRGHLFDVSEGWFVYDRSGTHIAAADDIAVDYSLIFYPSNTPVPARPHYWGMYNWVHAPHIPMPEYRPHLELRKGESLTLHWGNVSLPYLDNFKLRGKKDFQHGPYPVTYGNGVFVWEPDLAEYPDMVLPVRSPYIISHAKIRADVGAGAVGESIRILISVDGGGTWQAVWGTGEGRAGDLIELDLSQTEGSPFGRYEYQVKIQTDAHPGKDLDDRVFDRFEITTVTQHNIFSLPQLLPGKNVIRVNGEVSGNGALFVTWNWDDTMGKAREHVSVIHETPHVFEIVTSGRKWGDVRLNYLEIRAGDDPGGANREVVVEDYPGTVNNLAHKDIFDTRQIIGIKHPPPLEPTAHYIDNIKDNRKVVTSLSALMVLKDDAAWDVASDLAFNSIKHPVKEMAIQALFIIDRDRAVPVLEAVLKKDPAVQWKSDKKNKFVELQHWYFVSAMIGRIFAVNGVTSAAPLLADVLDSVVANKDKAWQPHASIIKSLGMMGAKDAAPSIRPFLNMNADEAAVAVWALGELGDVASTEKIRQMFDAASYEMIELNSAVALCRLGDTARMDEILALLESPDENFRGFIAGALGGIGHPDVVAALEGLIVKERFGWVKAAAEASLGVMR